MQLIIVVFDSSVLGQVEEIVPIMDKIIKNAAVMSYIGTSTDICQLSSKP